VVARAPPNPDDPQRRDAPGAGGAGGAGPGHGAAGTSGDAGPARPPRAWALATLALVVLSGLLGFVAVDRFVAWLDTGPGDAAVAGLHVHDPALGWTNRPDFDSGDGVSTDGEGLRGGAAQQAPPAGPGQVRVLVLGDSRVFGSGVSDEQVWSTVLQRRLREEGEPVAILNGAVNGYSGVQSCRRGALLVPELHPDLVLVLLSPCWSLVDNGGVGDWIETEHGFAPASVVAGWPEALHGVALGLHRVLSASAIYQRQQAVQRVQGGGIDPGLRDFMLTRDPPPAARPLVEHLEAALATLRQACEAEGCEVRALLLPEVWLTNDGAWQRYLRDKASTGAPPPGTDRLEPLGALAELVESQGLQVRTLMQDVVRMAGDESRYFLSPGDDHWSAEGHAAMAASLEAQLRARGLLERLEARAAARPAQSR
jgi:lysophospholipase L1-like esterase